MRETTCQGVTAIEKQLEYMQKDINDLQNGSDDDWEEMEDE